MSGVGRRPLTVEQLRGMDKPTPVWMETDKKTIEGWGGYWCLCQRGHILTPGMVSMYADKMDGATFYAYPPDRIDREKWEPCMWCVLNGQFGLNSYCSSCGRPLTDEAWAELERRAFGEV